MCTLHAPANCEQNYSILHVVTCRYYLLVKLHFSGVDFLENTSIVTLRAGKTEACTDILIVDDNTALEEDETFTSQLMLFFPIPVDISTALVTIIDDDC